MTHPAVDGADAVLSKARVDERSNTPPAIRIHATRATCRRGAELRQ